MPQLVSSVLEHVPLLIGKMVTGPGNEEVLGTYIPVHITPWHSQFSHHHLIEALLYKSTLDLLHAKLTTYLSRAEMPTGDIRSKHVPQHSMILIIVKN